MREDHVLPVSAFCAKKKKKRKNTNKIWQVRVSSKLRGLFPSNVACEVVYISSTTCMNLVEIAPIVFKLK